jgi:hypothetical protein
MRGTRIGSARTIDLTVVPLDHDPKKWTPVFRKDHASPKIVRDDD